MPEQRKPSSAAEICKKILLVSVAVVIFIVVVFSNNLPLVDVVIFSVMAFFVVNVFGCCCATATTGDQVSDVTLASFKMVVAPTDREDVYLTKYSLPEQCFQCGADMTTQSLKLIENLTVTCPSCNNEIPCEGKFDTMPME